MNLWNHSKVEQKNNLIANSKYTVYLFKLGEQIHLPLKIWDEVNGISSWAVTVWVLSVDITHRYFNHDFL